MGKKVHENYFSPFGVPKSFNELKHVDILRLDKSELGQLANFAKIATPTTNHALPFTRWSSACALMYIITTVAITIGKHTLGKVQASFMHFSPARTVQFADPLKHSHVVDSLRSSPARTSHLINRHITVFALVRFYVGHPKRTAHNISQTMVYVPHTPDGRKC